MKMMLIVSLIGWGIMMGAVSAETEENEIFPGKAHSLLECPSLKPWTWDLEQGIVIDDFHYPPYVPESDPQAARTNRLLMRVVERLGPAGVVSMAHHKILCHDQDHALDWVVKVMVFKSTRACEAFWDRHVASQVRTGSIKVDNLGDVCWKCTGQAITTLHLRRTNVYVEAKGRQDHDAILLWAQTLDHKIMNPPAPVSTESFDPNTVP